MKTKVLDIRGLAADAAIEMIQEAAGALRRGGLVAFPTETVYGIGANAFDDEAVQRVYAAKGRPSDNPMIVHIARASDIALLSKMISPGIVKLADAFWPGPLTMVLEKRDEVPGCVTGGLATVGVRLPDSPAAIGLIRLAGTPVAAPSANLSGGPSPTKAEHVIRDLDGKVDVILAGEDCRVGIESTVVDMTVSPPEILRPGVVTQDALEAVLDTPVNLHPGLKTEGDGSRVLSPAAGDGATEDGSRVLSPAAGDGATEGDGAAPRSPGMKYRHYAPRAQMLVVEGAQEKVREELDRLKAMNEALGLRVGIMLFEERGYLDAAHDFYAELRALDDAGVDLIIAGALPEIDGVGFAVMNRMMRAAGFNIVRV
ncbi:MAG: L-threonylcarbamoyladenylate synthase [Clostridiales bacterium]|nr:L-threonylcarbamoyladenylate synthase [Clostridiales bacterium]